MHASSSFQKRKKKTKFVFKLGCLLVYRERVFSSSLLIGPSRCSTSPLFVIREFRIRFKKKKEKKEKHKILWDGKEEPQGNLHKSVIK